MIQQIKIFNAFEPKIIEQIKEQQMVVDVVEPNITQISARTTQWGGTYGMLLIRG